MITHDLDSTPLKIKTNTDIQNGEEETIRVWFYDSLVHLAGQVIIYAQQSMSLYMLKTCMDGWLSFTLDVSSEVEKVWIITKESGPRVKVECNGQLIIDLEISDSTCSDLNWGLIWNRDVTQIKFEKYDDASDYFFGLAAGVVLVNLPFKRIRHHPLES